MLFLGVTKVDVTIKATINDIEQIIIGIGFFNSLASGAKIVSPLAVNWHCPIAEALIFFENIFSSLYDA